MTARGAPRRAVLAFALSVAVSLAAPGVNAQAISLDPVGDGIAFGISFGFAGMSELILRFAPPQEVSGPTPVESLPSLDRNLMFPYSRQADVASTVLEYAAMLTPLVLAGLQDRRNALGEAAAYAQVFSVALGAKDLLKYLLPRGRPYTYQGGAGGVDPSEDTWSFPSGHATMAFTAAAFSTYLFLLYLPGSAPYAPLVLFNYSLAVLTASYRVLSGMHFVTDVVAGTALGLFCGFVIPSLVRPHGKLL